ncbi:DUF3500 domain-containing protein [Haloferula sargassicola]|uniref:DUF3500 domain-containing protein n=1 Tax=Haloferula sargassicola TaxID=490096 RepID=A0ABP9UVA2_9BACT
MLRSLLTFLALTVILPAAPPDRTALETAARKVLTELDGSGRAQAFVPFADAERENWHYTPRERRGVPLKSMTESQKAATLALVRQLLSEKGALKATQILTLESVLAELENNPGYRDPGKYTLTLFGNPAADQDWGFRFEGHHLSLNLTFAGDGFSVTPSFFGANPAEVPRGAHEGLRVLAAEEDLARALAVSLREKNLPVIFDQRAPAEILTGEERVAKPLKEVGVAAAEMSASQRDALLELIREYTGRYREDLARADMERIEKAGIEKIHFGWAGSLERGQAYYYRIQGPTFVMEAANTQNDANHIHTVWRDFEHDFGRDLLREHYHDHDH